LKWVNDLKLHRPVVNNVIQCLQEIFGDGFYADKVIERTFKNNRRLGSRDRKFVAETVYGSVRWWRLLWASLGEDRPSLEIPELWRLIGAYILLENPEAQLPPWEEFADLDPKWLERNIKDARKNPAARESVPDWLYELGVSELGETWDEALNIMNRPAPVVLRANTLKTNREGLKGKLSAEEIETDFAPETRDGLILRARQNVFLTEAFRNGLFEIQDGASQQVGPLLSIEPGMRVIDACAGAGGKALHIAALLRNKGKLICLDVNEKKLVELRKRASRAGVDVIETKTIESSKTIKRLEKSADRVLLDVPCSGLGILRRNPDTKWKLQPDEIPQLQQTQKQILFDYSQMVKPGGRLVYATCSVLPSENEKQVAGFLEASAGAWRLVEEKKFWPGTNRYDGFYAAALERLN
jgi:16S rRNA (cytosine967-C5)-methyltransferase